MLCAAVISCKKDTFISSYDASLVTSADTLRFDTVFTTTGSVTQSFKIFNTNNQKLRLSHVKIAGGNNSFFKLNVDGISGQEIDDVAILPNDSVYVFVQVKINPTSANLPFVIRDSISVSFNGNVRYVQLEAFGQNARFYRNLVLRGSSAWTDELPIVILGSLVVDTTATLTIRKGSKVYLHADAPIIVNGTLLTDGTKDKRVYFAGDRIDDPYRDFPAGWPGIYFSASSKNSVLKFTSIRNAYQGVVSEGLSINNNPKVTLKQTIVDNIYDAGILGINSSIQADNCLISNCGKNVSLIYGGDYHFYNCSVVTYGNFYIQHDYPVLIATNFAEQDNQFFLKDLQASFINCIFWGEGGAVDNELLLGKKEGAGYDVSFDNVIYKNKDGDLAAAQFIGNILENADPLFDSVNIAKDYYDFHITKSTSSPAYDNGSLTPFASDLDDKIRTSPFDLGAYEK